MTPQQTKKRPKRLTSLAEDQNEPEGEYPDHFKALTTNNPCDIPFEQLQTPRPTTRRPVKALGSATPSCWLSPRTSTTPRPR